MEITTSNSNMDDAVVVVPEEITKILEINLISAQNLKIPSSAITMMRRRMRTYTLAWVDPNNKLRSNLDLIGGENPTWNDKFIFRVSQDFIDGDTSAVQFQIYAVGLIRDYFIGTVRYILSSSPISSRSGDVSGIPGFSALHIRRPSGRVHGVLNIAATVYNSSDFPSLIGINTICFRDLIGKNNGSDYKFGEWQLSRFINHFKGYKRNEQKESVSEADESCEDSVYFSDGTDKTTSSSSSCTTITAFRDGNTVGSNLLVAGKRDLKSEGGGLLRGLMISQLKCGRLDQKLPFVKK
ncbi:uncharacterized protein [Rutidosis leptorrhynchoides]|uniref:uncharacterized protein n=1 Tax=Rutidosis leptorrhynchoides TaxID=125765 RepID=UPI003A9A5C24